MVFLTNAGATGFLRAGFCTLAVTFGATGFGVTFGFTTFAATFTGFLRAGFFAISLALGFAISLLGCFATSLTFGFVAATFTSIFFAEVTFGTETFGATVFGKTFLADFGRTFFAKRKPDGVVFGASEICTLVGFSEDGTTFFASGKPDDDLVAFAGVASFSGCVLILVLSTVIFFALSNSRTVKSLWLRDAPRGSAILLAPVIGCPLVARIFNSESADWLPSTGGVLRRLARDLLAFEEPSAARTRIGSSGTDASTVRSTSSSLESTLRRFSFGLLTGGKPIGGAEGGVDRGGVKIGGAAGGVTMFPTGGLTCTGTGAVRVNGIVDEGRLVASDGDGVLDSMSAGIAAGVVTDGVAGTPLPTLELGAGVESLASSTVTGAGAGMLEM